MSATDLDVATYQKACAAFGRACAHNASITNRTVGLLARHRPEILGALLKELRAFNWAAVRAHRAIEAELGKRAAWEVFLEDHPELEVS